MELGQAFPPRAPPFSPPPPLPVAQSTGSGELMGYSRVAGEGLQGCPAPGTDRWAIMLAFTQPSHKMHEAIFSFHPTNLSKLNCNYGGSRKLYLPTKTVVMGFQERHVLSQPSGQAGNFFRVNQIYCQLSDP